jgi:ATP-binding cassette subfamily B protein
MSVAVAKTPLAWREVRESLRFGWPLAWGSNRRLCVWLLVTSATSAIVGPLLVLVLGASVSEIQSALDNSTAGAASLTPWVALAAGLSLLVATTDEVRRYLRRRLEDEIQLRVDSRLIWHVAGLDVAALEDPSTQDALQRATVHPGRSVLAMLLGIIDSFSGGYQALVYLALLLWIEPVWSMLLLAAALPHVATRWYVSRANHITIRSRTTAKRWGAYYRELLQNHRLIPELKVLRLAPLLADRFEASVSAVLRASRRIYRIQAVTHLVSTMISIAAVLVILCMVGRRAMAAEIALGSFVAYWTGAWRMRAVISHFSDAVSTLLDAHCELTNVREVLQLKPAIPNQGGVRQPLQGRIELRDLTFLYPTSTVRAIDGVSAVIEAGECVALVGPNGAGKTTLAKLITRLYEPSAGSVWFDGVDIRDWDASDLHRQIAVVFQEPARFEATVADNIAFGDWERLLPDPALIHDVARRTGFHDCVEELPQRYATHVGRQFGQVDLSGGQWRQLAVTRGLANDPALIILDEPTANLDVYAEERFFQSIRQMLAGRTSILISHRFSTLRLADRLLVLDGGRLVEQGSHDELVRRNGLYASMYRAFSARWSGDRDSHADAA